MEKLIYLEYYWEITKYNNYVEIYYSKYDKTVLLSYEDFPLFIDDNKVLGSITGNTIFRINNARVNRFIAKRMGLNVEGKIVDHIDGNPLNNRRENLRLATNGQNSSNRKATGSSHFLGVFWAKNNKCWITRIKRDGKYIYQEYFKDELEAAEAYNKKVKEINCEFGRINDITKGYSNNNKPREKEKVEVKEFDNENLIVYYPRYQKETIIPKKYLYLIKGKQKYYIGDLSSNYLRISSRNNKKEFFHRVIFELENGKIPSGKVIDHINLNSLDNRLENLRLLTTSENNRNKKSSGKHKYRGVVKNKIGNTWGSYCTYKDKKYYLGTFKTEEDAARAFDDFCKENNIVTRLNFG